MIRNVTILILLLPVLSCAQLSPQSKKVTETFFPEHILEINTPAFAKKKGFTTHAELIAFLNELVSKHPAKAKLSVIGKSQEGKDIPMIVVTNPDSQEAKTRVFMQGGLHGDEPASTEAMLFLLHQMLNNDSCAALLNTIELGVIPMANIDGFEKQNRYAANGLDLNRDQTKLLAPETTILKNAFNAFDAQVAVDFHEYRPFRADYAKMSTFGVTSIYDVMFMYSGNLNVPQVLRNYTNDVFISDARRAMESVGFRHHDYFSTEDHSGHTHFHQGSSNARSSATSFALRNTISALIEVRGVGLNRTSFTRRVHCGYLVAMSFLKTTSDNAEGIHSLLNTLNDNTSEAIVTSQAEEKVTQLAFIDLDKNEEISLDVTVHDAFKSTPTLKRSRPVGYVLLPGYPDLSEKLLTLGFTLVAIDQPQFLEVEKYIATASSQDSEKYEGVFRQHVSTTTEMSRKEFPQGTQVLLLEQSRSNLAIELFEPEAKNSFVSFGLLKVEMGDELPIYRLKGDFKSIDNESK
ncbi:MAG: peptidase [Cryomorphaceae bacterium]|nr:peptidase [Cryomorphaceae bacterium]